MMTLTSGLLAGQVLQRDRRNVGGARVSGRAGVSGAVEVCVRRMADGRVLMPWRRAGRASAGRWTARVTGLPAGGPYRVEFRIRSRASAVESSSIPDVYVGDVWFLAGQSNMHGRGNIEDAPRPNPLVRCFYMRDEWGPAAEPLHCIAEAVDTVHTTLGLGGRRPTAAEAAAFRAATTRGVGPGLWFGLEMARRTGVPQGLVACAHGGTSMAQWSPRLKKQGGASLYGAMLRRYRKLGQPVAGLLWYQGCAETRPDQPRVATYTRDMKRLVAAVRRDFGLPRLPWAFVQIGRVLGRTGKPAEFWNAIQDQQRRLADAIPNADVVPAADLDLDDPIHINGRAQGRLGRRLARVMARLALGDRREPPALRLESVVLAQHKTPGNRGFQGVTVAFANVAGGLRSGSRPAGFTLTGPDGQVLDIIVRTHLQGRQAVLELGSLPGDPKTLRLHYGLGCNPYVNIADARDMAVPVLGPVPVSVNAGPPYLTDWEVAPLGMKPDGLATPWQNLAAGARFRRAPRRPYPALPAMVMPETDAAKRRGLYLFRTRYQVPAGGRRLLSLGSDSGVAVRLNGCEVYRNGKATNPMVPDVYQTPVRLRRGRNVVEVAFDARDGKGWGFALRFLSPAAARPATTRANVQARRS